MAIDRTVRQPDVKAQDAVQRAHIVAVLAAGTDAVVFPVDKRP